LPENQEHLMTKSRRKFLQAGLMAAVFAATPVKNAFTQSSHLRDGSGEAPPLLTDPLANYSKSAFAAYLNSVFQIESTAGVVDVNLIRIDDLPAPARGECFSLLFRGGSRALKQDTYEINHPALGSFELFLVPAAVTNNGACEYVATINRLSSADYANISVPSRAGSRRPE
jgi:Domain of unknown function (DUF6916)